MNQNLRSLFSTQRALHRFQIIAGTEVVPRSPLYPGDAIVYLTHAVAI